MFIPLHRISKKHILGKFAAFKLPLRGMPTGTHKYEYELGTEFFRNMESQDILSGKVKVDLTVRHDNDTYYLDFAMNGTINIPCDRCLDEMEHEVASGYSLRVKYGEEYSNESDELLIIPESDSYLNVAYMIYDTVALTIPMKHTHPFGKCNKAMTAQLKKHSYTTDDDADAIVDDNEGFESDNDNESQEIDPRWEALKKIKEDNN